MIDITKDTKMTRAYGINASKKREDIDNECVEYYQGLMTKLKEEVIDSLTVFSNNPEWF